MDFFKNKIYSSLFINWFVRNKYFFILEEEKQRLEIFRDNLKCVLESNIKQGRTFQLELNEYADWTVEEFVSLKTGLVTSDDHPDNRTDGRAYQASARRSLSELGQDNSHFRRSKRNLHTRRNKDRCFFSDWFWDFFNKHEDENDNDNNDDQSTDRFDWHTKGVVSSVKNQIRCESCYAFATIVVMESFYAIKTNSQSVIDFSPQQIVDIWLY
jgi:C1A family cysteine protease